MYTQKGTADKSSLILKHQGLVKKIAGILKARLPANIEIDDLVQAGTIGLWHAINNFDSSLNVTFETYASQRIRGAMLDELRGGDWAPRSLRSNMRSIESSISALAQKLGRDPKDSEVAQYMGMPLEEYRGILADNAGHQLVYLEDLAGDEGDVSGFLDRYQASDSDNPLSVLLDAGFKADLVQAIEVLPEREKLMMGLYYEEELNMKEIGAVLGVSEARVCQIHTQAVARLRTKLGRK